MRTRLLELLRFGSIGALAFVVDAGLFNLLRYGPGELLAEKPLTAKVLSVAAATLTAWLGNRYWTFAGRRHRGRTARTRELVAFALVNVAGMGVAVACLAFSHYVLGLTSPLADNVAGNVVGTALGTVLRYFAYRHLVFTGGGGHAHVAVAADEPHDAAAALAAERQVADAEPAGHQSVGDHAARRQPAG